MATEVEIDDSLYSRQRYVLGDGAMQRMANSTVLLCGLGGLGVEIAKNVVLAGVKSITLQDNKGATYHDLGTQFFLREEDVKAGKNRAEACKERVAELNPYVNVNTRTEPLYLDSDLSFLAEYQCVILTETILPLQLKVDAFCRQHQPPISFISADVYGVFGSVFCDMGPEFEVIDANGEEPKDVFVHSISKANPGVVTALENRMHGFETGDTVTFKEVKGMTALNGKQCQIKVLTPFAFSICDTSGADFGVHESGGICSQVKVPKLVHFNSLETELKNPSLLTADLSKIEAPANIHVGLQALNRFRASQGRLPNIRCTKDADLLLKVSQEVNEQMECKVENLDEGLLRQLSYTCQGCLAPLCAALGGIVAQEALKALTGKFSPLMQWLLVDAGETVQGLEEEDVQTFMPQQERYDSLRICIGEKLCKQLSDLRLFMVGCGAIGCEMLKNYALLGVSTSSQGQITITDNDLIEKSNLNRQFLFRPQHIRKPKSTTAADSARDINKDLRIDAHQHKVCPQTEHTVYTDSFFNQQDVVVNALDNLEARRYMDSRCVTNVKPLLESGTMGAKGHVQVIVPHLTESYGSQRDPPDEDVPYCTLKSFPAQIEHCIQWARDKFESSFSQKPSLFNKFWSVHQNPQDVIQALLGGAPMEGSIQTSKISALRPCTWSECITIGRLKFEKYFNHRAKQLIHSFPLDTKLQDGTPFWQSPKRPPCPVEFNIDDDLHIGFVTACARLYGDISGVKITEKDLEPSSVKAIVRGVKVPAFRPANKTIETDEAAKKPDEPEEITGDETKEAGLRIRQVLGKLVDGDTVVKQMYPASFEKDDDRNGHIDFITTASNLRASMYNIELADRLKTKRIAGRIVPAIATTTAAVAGLVSIELIKLLKKCSLEQYKNCFLNLALPVCIFSEPGPVEKTTMSNGIQYTLWDRWDVQGNKDMTLQQFIDTLKAKHGVQVGMVVHGVKMVYVPIMIPHKKRLPQPMSKLIKPPPSKPYVDLSVAYVVPNSGGDDEMGPPVRYYFNS